MKAGYSVPMSEEQADDLMAAAGWPVEEMREAVRNQGRSAILLPVMAPVIVDDEELRDVFRVTLKPGLRATVEKSGAARKRADGYGGSRNDCG